MKNKVYIMGGAQTDFERNWTKEGKTFIAMLKEAVADGFKDAGFSMDEMARLNKENRVCAFVGNFIAELYISQGHLGAFLTEINPAFYGVPSGRYEAACASSSVALDAAITKILAEEYDVCVVVGWEIMKSVSSRIGGDILGRAAYYEKEGKGVDFPFPKLFARLADATIEKYGLDKFRYLNVLARISAINYSNAKRNPLAQTRKWFMSYEEASHRGTESNPYVGGLFVVRAQPEKDVAPCAWRGGCLHADCRGRCPVGACLFYDNLRLHRLFFRAKQRGIPRVAGFVLCDFNFSACFRI